MRALLLFVPIWAGLLRARISEDPPFDTADSDSASEQPTLAPCDGSNGGNCVPVDPNITDPMAAAAVTTTEAPVIPEEECNPALLMPLEQAWVKECYGWDHMDPNIATELAGFVNYATSELTTRGSAEVCVKGEPCIAAVHAFYKAMVEEGCAERNAQESTYKLARNLERVADGCTVFGAAAALDHHPPSMTVGGPNSFEGCYHDYPSCSPHCMTLPGFTNHPAGQRMHELYMAPNSNGAPTCYKALSRCQGCLFLPDANPDDLQPWNCPEQKCADPPRFNVADGGATSPENCETQCLGYPPCGHDGCGGQCGLCHDDEKCVENACIYRPFSERFVPKDERAMPEWFSELRNQEWADARVAKREDNAIDRLVPDMSRTTIASKLGIAPGPTQLNWMEAR